MGHLQARAFFAACSPQGQQRAFSDKEPATGLARCCPATGTDRWRVPLPEFSTSVTGEPTDETINQSDGLFHSV